MSNAAEIGGAAPPLRPPASVRGFVRDHPEWWVVVASAAAWGMMIFTPDPHAGHHGHAPAAGRDALATAVMIVAMMLPLTLPAIRHVSRSRPRPYRPVAGYLAGYLAVWMLGMFVLTRTWTLTASLAGPTAAAAGVVLAATLWELARSRQRHAHQCERTVPLASRGWKADADCARFGATSGIRCFGMCWGVMAVCVAFSHGVPLMAVLTGVQLAGRYVPRIPPTLTSLAILGAGAAAFAMHIGA